MPERGRYTCAVIGRVANRARSRGCAGTAIAGGVPSTLEIDMSNDTYKGSCFCGAVELAVSGQPAAMGFCHCGSCRSWSAGPVNAFTLWSPDAVRITKGAEDVATYNKTPVSYRKWCKKCGGHVMTDHPPFGLIDVYAATIPDFPFQPALHVHYGESVLPIKDGLPKQKDMPAEMGGSGVVIAE
jgi:hypothetical protein